MQNENYVNIFWLFFYLVTIAIFVALILYFNRVIHNLRKEISQKNDLVQYYTLELESLKTEHKNILQSRENIIRIVIHDLRSPLFFLFNVINYVHSNYSSLGKKELRTGLTKMYDSSIHISTFVNDLMTWVITVQKDFIPKITAKLFNEFIKDKLSVYIEIANQKGLSFIIESNSEYILYANFDLLLIVMRNIIDNAIKNTSKGGITVNAYDHDYKQYITIIDTGLGMSMEKKSELQFGIYFNKSIVESHFGFQILHGLIMKMNGRVEIESILGSGTKITLMLPKEIA